MSKRTYHTNLHIFTNPQLGLFDGTDYDTLDEYYAMDNDREEIYSSPDKHIVIAYDACIEEDLIIAINGEARYEIECGKTLLNRTITMTLGENEMSFILVNLIDDDIMLLIGGDKESGLIVMEAEIAGDNSIIVKEDTPWKKVFYDYNKFNRERTVSTLGGKDLNLTSILDSAVCENKHYDDFTDACEQYSNKKVHRFIRLGKNLIGIDDNCDEMVLYNPFHQRTSYEVESGKIHHRISQTDFGWNDDIVIDVDSNNTLHFKVHNDWLSVTDNHGNLASGVDITLASIENTLKYNEVMVNYRDVISIKNKLHVMFNQLWNVATDSEKEDIVALANKLIQMTRIRAITSCREQMERSELDNIQFDINANRVIVVSDTSGMQLKNQLEVMLLLKNTEVIPWQE